MKSFLNKKIFIVLPLQLFLLCKLSAQRQSIDLGSTENANVGIVVGYTGLKQNMIEFGIGFQPWEVQGFFVSYPFAGFLATYEFSPTQRLYGTNINAWYLGGPFSFGLNLNRYSDYKKQTFGIKPMLGISFLRIGVMYGYNFFLNPNSIDGLAHNSITVKYYLPVWKKKEKNGIPSEH